MNETCNKCGVVAIPIYSIRFFPVMPEIFKSATDPRNPKYTLRVRADCRSCQAFIKFVAQTNILIDYLNAATIVEQKEPVEAIRADRQQRFGWSN